MHATKPKMAKKWEKKMKGESVNEVQKRQATDIAVKFDKAYLNFSREIRDIIKMVVKITGNRTDGKIFDKSYTKHLIPFDALFKSWYKGQQNNPHIKESDLGYTTKKQKVVRAVHKASGKELIYVDTPSSRKTLKKMGFVVKESVNEKKGDFLSSLFPKVKVDKAIKIAKKMSGNMTGAVKAIEKFFPGMSKHNDVQDALRTSK